MTPNPKTITIPTGPKAHQEDPCDQKFAGDLSGFKPFREDPGRVTRIAPSPYVSSAYARQENTCHLRQT